MDVGNVQVEPATEEAFSALRAAPLFRTIDDAGTRKLAAKARPLSIASGDVVFRRGEVGDALFVIARGRLGAVDDERAAGGGRVTATFLPGEIVGEVEFVIGGARSLTVVACEESTVYELPRPALEEAAAQERTLDQPKDRTLAGAGAAGGAGAGAGTEKPDADMPGLLGRIAALVLERLRRERLRSVLPALFGGLEAALAQDLRDRIEWISLRRGETLFREGDPGDALFIVLSGRLRAFARDAEGGERAVGEIGSGESVGEMALVSNARRAASVVAVRDAELARIEKAAFDAVVVRRPELLLGINRVLVDRVIAANTGTGRTRRAGARHVTVVAAAPGAPAAEVARRLEEALGRLGRALRVDAAALKKKGVLPPGANLPEDHPGWTRFLCWVEEQAAAYDHIVFETDPEPTSWTARALRQADLVLLVGRAADAPAPGPVESLLLDEPGHAATDAPRALLLIQDDAARLPLGTARWLAPRKLAAHYHARLGRPADFERLARHLAGRATGVVLGGGGARGYAHIGVLKAMRELGLHVDAIGGTSMGAIISAQFAMEIEGAEMLALNHRMIALRPFQEYTLPFVSFLRSRRIDAGAQDAYGETQIEDLWLPWFGVSSNLTTAEAVIHERGSVRRAVRASMSLPGIALPVVDGKSLLVDGGVINNLPGDVMRARCRGTVIAVNVSPEDDVSVQGGEIPSPWRILAGRIVPFVPPVRVPGIFDILMRTTMLASTSQTSRVRREVDLYLAPPIQKYGMIDFEKIDEIAEVGYSYAKEPLAAFAAKRKG